MGEIKSFENRREERIPAFSRSGVFVDMYLYSSGFAHFCFPPILSLCLKEAQQERLRLKTVKKEHRKKLEGLTSYENYLDNVRAYTERK